MKISSDVKIRLSIMVVKVNLLIFIVVNIVCCIVNMPIGIETNIKVLNTLQTLGHEDMLGAMMLVSFVPLSFICVGMNIVDKEITKNDREQSGCNDREKH